MKLSIAHSKTDHEAAGQIVGMIASGNPDLPPWRRGGHGWRPPTSPMARCSAAIDRHDRIAADLPDRAIALNVKTARDGGRRRSTVTGRCAPAAGRDPARHSVGGTGGIDTQVPIPAQSLAGDSCSVADQGYPPGD